METHCIVLPDIFNKEVPTNQRYGTYPDMDRLVTSRLVEDRIHMACLGYGVDKLKDDPDPHVRKAVASNGYYLSEFINDESLLVQKEVEKFYKE